MFSRFIYKKCLSESNKDAYNYTNSEGKTPLYAAIHNGVEVIVSHILKNTKVENYKNANSYLFKAIRMRDPKLVSKLIEWGVDTASVDDQGYNAFHILFANFNKMPSKCALIGEILLASNVPINAYNFDNWAPIHIAARKGNRDCIKWIVGHNRNSQHESKEQFEMNAKGKNNWSPLHIAVTSFTKFEEVILLLENGCDVFAKNNEFNIPRKVANSNYLVSKLLRQRESELLTAQLIDPLLNSSFRFLPTLHEEQDESMDKINDDKFATVTYVDDKIDTGRTKKISATDLHFMSDGLMDEFEEKRMEVNTINKKKRGNIHYYKDVLLSDTTLTEKYEALMQIKTLACLTDKHDEVESVIGELIGSIQLDREPNRTFFFEICKLVVVHQMTGFLGKLESICANMEKKGRTRECLELTDSLNLLRQQAKLSYRRYASAYNFSSRRTMSPKKGVMKSDANVLKIKSLNLKELVKHEENTVFDDNVSIKSDGSAQSDSFFDLGHFDSHVVGLPVANKYRFTETYDDNSSLQNDLPDDLVDTVRLDNKQREGNFIEFTDLIK